MEIVRTKDGKKIVSYKTIHQETTGSARFFIERRTPRQLWCNSYGVPYEGFCPLMPKEVNPVTPYDTAIIDGFFPNAKNTQIRRQGNGSRLLKEMCQDAKNKGAELVAVTNVSTPAMETFLRKKGFTNLARSRNYIKKL